MAASIQVMMAARFFAMTTGRAQPFGRPWKPQTPQRPPHVKNPNWPDAPGRNPKFTPGQPAKACSLEKRQWHSSATNIPPPRETPPTAATTCLVLTSRPSKTSTRLTPYISPVNSLNGPCEPATECHDPTKPPRSVLCPRLQLVPAKRRVADTMLEYASTVLLFM